METEKYGILDISDDISQWEITRRSNAPSSFNFMLQNTQRKYDRAFQPSDRITVELKRIVWVRVFTGSLNSVPIFSAWPRALPLSATCSLKKLQFWPWNPATDEASAMINQFMGTINNTTTKGDGGISSLIAQALVNVTNWDEKAIHIGGVPNDWFKFAQKTELAISAASDMSSVLAPAQIGGSSEFSSITLKPGKFGTETLDATQVNNAGVVYGTAKALGANDAQMIMTFMAAIDESHLYILGNPAYASSATLADKNSDGTPRMGHDHSSVGIFQQQPTQGWGTVAECMDIAHSTTSFVKRLLAKTKGTIPPSAYGVTINKVQISGGDGSNYQAFIQAATALTAACNNSAKATIAKGDISQPGSGQSPLDPTGSTPTGKTNYSGTGDYVAKVAYDLIHIKNNPPHIKYSQSQASDPRSDNPNYLDCSQLVRWVLYHVQGTVWNCRDTHSQYPALKIKNIPLNIAANIRGCLLYGAGETNGSFGSNPDHVGIAIGDGKTHVAAHTDDAPIAQQVDQSNLPGGLYSGALALGIDYTRAATNEASRAWLQAKLGKACYISSATGLGSVVDPSVTGSQSGLDGGTTDPFAQLVSALTLNPVVGGDLFGGSRQLMNNQPFLPWIGNLTNSTMRAYCSAPNGDFMAWFPDYFNVWKTAAIMDVKLIELKDFTVEWSDQQIVTHEFVVGSVQPTFDQASGSIMDGGVDGSYSGIYAMLGTEGIATMDFPQIFQTIYGKPASSAFTAGFLERFGARPNVEAMPNIRHGAQEFYMALWQFMKHWSEQFNATIPMTFMPELWPGMILRIQEYGFQAYVTEVTHRGSYGQGGGFTTEAKIIAPAPIDENTRGSLFGMLDVFEKGKTKVIKAGAVDPIAVSQGEKTSNRIGGK